jgi:hypothetical protein
MDRDGGGLRAPDAVGGVVPQQLVVEEAGVAFSAVGVEDPELRPPTRRTGPVAGDHHLRQLADDVASQPDPAPPGEFEAETGGLPDGRAQGGGQRRRLQQDQQRVRSAGERREAVEPVGDAGRSGRRIALWLEAGWQIHDEEVHRSPRQERRSDRPALVELLRRDDDQPLQPDAASDGLDGVEAATEVQPGDDRATGLGLGDESEGERRLAAPPGAAEGEARRPRHAAGAEDRIECREARRDNTVGCRERPRRRLRHLLRRQRRGGQGTDHLADRLTDTHPLLRSCGTPPRPEGRESSRHVRGEARHRTGIIEQTFDIVNGFGAGFATRRARPPGPLPPVAESS